MIDLIEKTAVAKKHLVRIRGIKLILHKKWSFPLKIYSVNVTKSTVSLMENFIFCAVSMTPIPLHISSFFIRNLTFCL